MMGKKGQCSEQVQDDSGWHFYKCSNPVTKTRDGKEFCTIHDPLYIVKKRKKQSEKWELDRKRERDRCLRDPRVVELREAAKEAQIRIDVTAPLGGMMEPPWRKRLRTALEGVRKK